MPCDIFQAAMRFGVQVPNFSRFADPAAIAELRGSGSSFLPVPVQARVPLSGAVDAGPPP